MYSIKSRIQLIKKSSGKIIYNCLLSGDISHKLPDLRIWPVLIAKRLGGSGSARMARMETIETDWKIGTRCLHHIGHSLVAKVGVPMIRRSSS